jgi:hypothetical protein
MTTWMLLRRLVTNILVSGFESCFVRSERHANFRTTITGHVRMYVWNDEVRVATTGLLERSTSEAHALFDEARSMIANPEKSDIGRLLRAHIAGVTSYADVVFYRLRELANELGRASGQLALGASFFDSGWNVDLSAVQRFCPDVATDIFEVRSNQAVRTTELLEASPNELMDLGWPTTLAGFMRRPRRLPLRAYETDDAVAYVHPYQYQILSRELDALWDTASPRSLSRQCLLDVEIVQCDRKVVIIQDRFDFRNFCHFLFDAATRVIHYVDYFGYSGELFVCGGVPGPYQDLVGQGLCKILRIPPESLYFPSTRQLFQTSKTCVWFSDQKELHTHPAQMAHPRSMKALSALADAVATSSHETRRVYVSRGDADRRRIVNESALTSALERRGFVSVQLGRLPVEEQIRLFRNAEVVVAPHGMGLTHIAMAKNLGKLIELFHPQAGTDAYAFVARAAGMEYHYVLGEGVPATHSDFSVDVGRILDVLGPEPVGTRVPHWQKNVNLVPASSTFLGFSSATGDVPEGWAQDGFAELFWGQSVHIHCKVDPPGNTLVGSWSDIEISPSTLYVASCWVWVPEYFHASALSIRIGGWKSELHEHADLKQPNRWQRISFTTVSPPSAQRCSVGLHVVGLPGAMIASSCWQLERGLNPSAYVPTGC